MGPASANRAGVAFACIGVKPQTRHSMTTIPSIAPPANSGQGAATGPAQGPVSNEAGQPTFSSALSQAQGREPSAPRQDASTAQAGNAAQVGASAATSTPGSATKDAQTTKAKHDPKAEGRTTAVGPSQTVVPTGPVLAPGAMLDPQTSAQEAVSRANLNTGIAAVSGKTLPLTAAMAAATSPLSRTEWPQPILPATNSLASSESGTGPADANAGLANGMAASKFLGKDATHQDAQALPNAWSKGRLGPEDAARLSGSDNTDQPVSPKGALLAKATGEQPLNGGASLQRSDASLAPGAASNTFPGALMPGALQLQAASPSAQTYTAALHVPVGAAPWGQELGRQMLFAVNGQQQLATLHLNPPQLGPLEVHLQLHDGQVNAQFVSPHQAVRQALESAMPQLHDLFTGAGLTLMQTSVDSGGTWRNMSQDRPSGSEGIGGVSASGNSARSNTQVPASQLPSWKQGLVNTYV